MCANTIRIQLILSSDSSDINLRELVMETSLQVTLLGIVKHCESETEVPSQSYLREKKQDL